MSLPNNESMQLVTYKRFDGARFSQYLCVDDLLKSYLEEVKASGVDAFGELVERNSYLSALNALNILLVLEFIEGEEYERLAALFWNAEDEANRRHARLVMALERRERMRSNVKARRVGVRG